MRTVWYRLIRQLRSYNFFRDPCTLYSGLLPESRSSASHQFVTSLTADMCQPTNAHLQRLEGLLFAVECEWVTPLRPATPGARLMKMRLNEGFMIKGHHLLFKQFMGSGSHQLEPWKLRLAARGYWVDLRISPFTLTKEDLRYRVRYWFLTEFFVFRVSLVPTNLSSAILLRTTERETSKLVIIPSF
jgi:hypothetical protein